MPYRYSLTWLSKRGRHSVPISLNDAILGGCRMICRPLELFLFLGGDADLVTQRAAASLMP